MFDALAEFRRRLFERPLRELGYFVAGYLLIDIPTRAVEETVISWCREELAEYLGITRPSVITVATFFWHWVVPVMGVFLMLLLYHRGNLRHASPNTTAGTPTTRPQDRDGFLPWFMVMAAIALFVIFERQGPSIKGTPVVFDTPNLEGAPLGIAWDSVELKPSGAAPPAIGALVILAKNLGSDEIALKDAYVISAIDSTAIQMTVNTPPGPDYKADGILPIPPNAWINFTATFPAGLSEAAFVSKWGSFRVVIQYGDITAKHYYDQRSLVQAMRGIHPEAAPHVSPKPP